jgi:thiamine pyrophosphate-dependent acetolactate synthase large subunit-like protein
VATAAAAGPLASACACAMGTSGGTMGKERKRETILKTDRRNLLLELGLQGKFSVGELDRLVTQCDAVMFLGYGFSDIHFNLSFEKFRDSRRRPVVVVDLAPDRAMNANGIEWADGRQTVTTVLGLFRTQKSTMSSLGFRIPKTSPD